MNPCYHARMGVHRTILACLMACLVSCSSDGGTNEPVECSPPTSHVPSDQDTACDPECEARLGALVNDVSSCVDLGRQDIIVGCVASESVEELPEVTCYTLPDGRHAFTSSQIVGLVLAEGWTGCIPDYIESISLGCP